MKNNSIILFTVLLFSLTSIAQTTKSTQKTNSVYTAIPDSNFEQTLINLGIDAGSIDHQVLTANIANRTILNVSNKNISDLTGIENFTNLTELYCYSNQLIALDLSKNTALKTLYCYSNQLTTLDFTKNTDLTNLQCYSNQLTTLNLINNIALKTLNCSTNKLTTLDLSQNTSLNTLHCTFNKFTTLDVTKNIDLKEFLCFYNLLTTLNLTKNTNLTTLGCQGNKLIDLDLSKNTSLKSLFCFENQLTALDLSKNMALTNLECHTNNLKNLDVTQNTLLTSVSCSKNQLVNLNLKNGNNNNITFFNATNNPDLTCIQVDNITPPNTSWYKDSFANYSITACFLSNNTFEKNTDLAFIYPNPTNDILNIIVPLNTELKKVEVFSLTGQKVETTTQSQISFNHLAKGEYLLIVETGAGHSTKKVIKN